MLNDEDFDDDALVAAEGGEVADPSPQCWECGVPLAEDGCFCSNACCGAYYSDEILADDE